MNDSGLLRSNRPAQALAALVLLIAGLIAYGARFSMAGGAASAGYALSVLLVIVAFFIPQSLMMANQWEKAIVLRYGRLQGVRGPGLFLIVPIIDRVAAWIDGRIQTTEFNAEQALSRDTVPVNIDAVVFWQVHDAERAALEIIDYRSAVARVSQTSLREMVGSSLLSHLLSDRQEGDEKLRETIGRKTAGWGVSVVGVEIRDIGVPDSLQDAMSRQAQAERERLARVALAEAEREVAQKFVEAAETYASNPAALQLRAMNIIYETTKERGATILIPTGMVDSMNPAAALGLLAAGAEAAPKG